MTMTMSSSATSLSCLQPLAASEMNNIHGLSDIIQSEIKPFSLQLECTFTVIIHRTSTDHSAADADSYLKTICSRLPCPQIDLDFSVQVT